VTLLVTFFYSFHFSSFRVAYTQTRGKGAGDYPLGGSSAHPIV